MRPRSTHIMVRSLICGQRRAEPGHAGTQCRRGTVAGPAGVPSVIRILYGADVICCRKEGAERGRVRANYSCFIRTVDKQRCEACRKCIVVVVCARAEEGSYLGCAICACT